MFNILSRIISMSVADSVIGQGEHRLSAKAISHQLINS